MPENGAPGPPRAKTPAYRLVAAVVKPFIRLLARRQYTGQEHLPPPGTGFIAAFNHTSNLDWPMTAEYLYDHATPPAILIKDPLFRVPIVGWALRATGQIPVYRGSARAADALVGARAALAEGRCVMIFPEGTITRDPDTWPMASRPGVGRLALATGAPVIPVAQWGAEAILPRSARRPRLIPRATVTIRAGAPVDLADLAGRSDAAAAREATARVMADVTALLTTLRGGTPPEEPFDPYRQRSQGGGS
jgi:1-acyl-sn-glycerol-3-phosphate acyltransferase